MRNWREGEEEEGLPKKWGSGLGGRARGAVFHAYSIWELGCELSGRANEQAAEHRGGEGGRRMGKGEKEEEEEEEEEEGWHSCLKLL